MSEPHDTGAPGVAVTEKMIEAGVYELAYYSARDDDDETAVVMIYKAMFRAKEAEAPALVRPAEIPLASE